MLASILALALAAPGPDDGLRALQAADARLAAVAFRLQTASLALCPDVEALPGFSVQALTQFPPREREAVARVLGLDARPAIAAVAPGSAAARAGLVRGDRLVAIDGVVVPTSEARDRSYAQVAVTEARLAAALAAAPAELTIEHAGVAASVALMGDRGCASRVQLVPGNDINARADGRYVQIEASMYDFVGDDDDQLAAVVAHELAHNILRHRVRLDAARVGRGLFAGGRSGAALRTTEYEADRLSIWLMARAGFDERDAVPFWTRLSGQGGGGLLSDRTHPGWRDRIARIATAVAEVRAQRVAGVPLVPPPAPMEQSASQSRNRR